MHRANRSLVHLAMTSILTLIAILVAAPGLANAALLFSDDFENPSSGGDNSFALGVPPAGWSATGGALIGLQNPDNQTYTGTTGSPGTITNMVGPQILSVFADNNGTLGNTNGISSVSRTLANTLAIDTTYTATISIGRRGLQNSANLSLGYVFELLAGSTVIASASADGSALANNTFTVVSISHLAVGTDPIGQALSLRFGTNVLSPGAQRATDFDAVSLVSAVPEPASISLIGVAGLALLRRRVRLQK